MKIKKLLALVLSLILAFSCVSVIPFTVVADDAATVALDIETKKAIYIGATGSQKRIANIFYGLTAVNSGEDGFGNFSSEDWSVDGYTYFQLTFKAKMLSGTKPIISFIRRGANSTTSGSQTEPKWVTNGYSYGAGNEPEYISYEYNPDTYECKVIFAVESYVTNWAGPWGFICIGNQEGNNLWQSEYDFDASFIMTDPVVQAYYPVELDDEFGGASGNNLVSDFSDANVNMSSAYVHTGNSSTTSSDLNSMGRAPGNKWSVQSSPSLVKQIEVPADFFDADSSATFTKHAETDTVREYYTSSSYEGLYFEKIGNTYKIIEDINKKMMVIEANKPGETRTANIALPLMLDQYWETAEAPNCSSVKCYVKVTFKAKRLAGDSQPMLTRLYGDTKTYKTSGGGACAYNITAGESGLPKSTYNADTGEFVGWIRLWRGSAGQLFPNTVNEIILIGNTEVASSGADKCLESSFAIYDINVDLYGSDATTLVATDIAPDFYAENIYDDYGYVASTGTANSDKADRSVARASANVWNVQGDPYMVNDYNLNSCILNNHTRTYNAETSTSVKHYSCATCGKNYADPYGSEVLDDVSATQKMILIKSTEASHANAIMPLDFLDWDTANDQYYLFKCKMKLYGDQQLPSIQVVNPTVYSTNGTAIENGGTYNGDSGDVLWSYYDEATMTYTAAIKLYFSSCSDYWAFYYRSPQTLAHQAIILGNAKHAGTGLTDTAYSTAFAFSDPQLYKLKNSCTRANYSDSLIDGEDLCTNITDKSLNFGESYRFSSTGTDTTPNNIMAAPANMWSIDGYSRFISAYDVPENFFTDSDTDSKMLRISGVEKNQIQAAASFETFLTPGATYQFDIDYRNFGGSQLFVQPQIAVSSYSTISEANREYTSDNVDGSHMSFRFTVPSDARISSSSNGNFRLNLGRYWDSSLSGTAYFSNVSLRKVTSSGLGANVIYDEDFSYADETILKSNNFDNNLIGWVAGNIDTYTKVDLMDAPEDFFTGDVKEVKDIAVKFDGGDWHVLDFKVNLEPSTTYRLTYNYRSKGDMPTLVTQGTGSVTINNVSATNNGEYLQTYELVTSADKILSTNNKEPNTRIRFSFGANSYDKEFYIANLKLHKVVDGEIIGTNIIGDFNPIYDDSYYAGLSNVGDSIALTLDQDTATAITRDIARGWHANFGSDSNVSQYASLVKVADDFFNIVDNATKRTNLRNMLLNLEPIVNNPDSNLNSDSDVNICDLVYMMNRQKVKDLGDNYSGAVDLYNKITKEENITAPSSKVYYVSSKSGTDSRAGGTSSAPFKTLSYALDRVGSNTGYTILLERGSEFRIEEKDEDGFIVPSGTTIGTYGTGAKPVIYGSAKNYTGSDNWSNVTGNVWRTRVDGGIFQSTDDTNIPGNIYFFNSASDSEPSLIGTLVKNGARFANYNELSTEGEFFTYTNSDSYDGYIYVYSNGNPGSKYKRIEIAEKRTVLTLGSGDTVSDVRIDNIAIKYAGGHGINAARATNTSVTNCEIGYVGGAPLNAGIMGNGIQFCQGGSNITIDSCYVYQCFDAGITFQSFDNEETTFQNVNFTNNLLTNSFYNIEFFTTGTPENKNGSSDTNNGTFKNINISGNIMRYAGECFSYNQRLAEEGNYRCANIGVTKNAYYINTSGLNIVNNVFDCTMGSQIYWTWANKDVEEHPGLTISGNAYYQKSGATDSRVMMFGNTSSYDYASSQYGLENSVRAVDDAPSTIMWLDTIK